jgi:EAL domain-containing protein (putative c-di-GMP-specific phosphodiesterase class I)/PleD family two-component response regulator
VIKKNKKKEKQMQNSKVLYVEDNRDISEEVAFFLGKKVQELLLAYDGQEGLEVFKQSAPDVVITDVQMPKMDGLEMIEKIREINPEIPIIITTAFNESDYLLKAINLKVDAYVVKPLNLKKLIETVEKVLEPLRLKKELQRTNEELKEINANLDKIVQKKTHELEYLYSHEQITGLCNFIKLNEAIDSAEYKYLLLLDVSNFSIFNRQYGKTFSNEILKKAANELEKHMKGNTELFKIESDKFVILSQEEDTHELELFCQQIISYFDVKALHVADAEISINFAIGIEKIKRDTYPLINAEYALEAAKNLGGRAYHFYDENDDTLDKATYEIAWLNITKQMIKDDKIEAYYQPIMDIASGKIRKYEVLARGNYEGKIYSPYYFIGSAEKLGLIDSITRIIINKSFAKFSGSDMQFSLNITQRDLLDEYFDTFLEDKMELYTIKPEQVTFEVLENITVGKHQDIILESLKRLKERGFKIAVDDFGVENSNFSRLLEINFDFIKLDAIFIKNISHSKNDRTIVSAMVSMSKSLGIETIAEYVESEEILDVLRKNGVTMAQGYFVGKPQPYLLDEKN